MLIFAQFCSKTLRKSSYPEVNVPEEGIEQQTPVDAVDAAGRGDEPPRRNDLEGSDETEGDEGQQAQQADHHRELAHDVQAFEVQVRQHRDCGYDEAPARQRVASLGREHAGVVGVLGQQPDEAVQEQDRVQRVVGHAAQPGQPAFLEGPERPKGGVNPCCK